MRGGTVRARLISVAVLAACGTPTKPTARPDPVAEHPQTPNDASAPVAVADGGEARPIVHTPSKRTKIEAPHGGAITSLAVTPDGGSVISADELDGVRLWPALDGTVEPRAIDLQRPDKLAIGRDPRGFVIAMIDEVGGLTIQVVDSDGLTLSRAVLPLEPGFAGVVMTDTGPVAWRSDQRVVSVKPDGTIGQTLAADPGQRIVGLAAAGGKLLAIIETEASTPPKRRARWLTGLAWGAWLNVKDIASTVTLSPSGKKLAFLSGDTARTGGRYIVADTASGSEIANEPATGNMALALPDDDHLAMAVGGAVNWVDISKAKPSQPPAPTPVAGSLDSSDRGIVAAGGGRVITGLSGELVLATPSKTEYLGYELESPAVAAAAPNGRLLIGLGETFAVLDKTLAAQPAPDLSVPQGSAIADLHWLAGDDWLVESSRVNDGVTSILLVDASTKKTREIRNGMSMVQMLLYEPATKLATLSLGDAPQVLRHEPGKLKMERISTLPKPSGFERAELVPVVPALANGTEIVVVQMRDRLTLRWAHDARALDKGPQVTIDGSLAGVDGAAHVYVWQNDPAGMLELAIFSDGKRIGTLPTDGPTAVWPDPKGTQVVEVGQRSIALVGIDGKRKWAQALQGVTEALWLDDNTIAIVSAAGVARLDAANGAVLAARCGWRFGKTTKQHPVSPRFEPVCTQLR
jgi:hypothetical protein